MKKLILFIVDFLQWCAFKTVYIVLNLLPMAISYPMASFFGTCAFLVSRKHVKRIYYNLDLVYPEGPPFDRKKFARKVFIHFAYMFLEFFLAPRHFNKNNWREKVSGEVEKLEKYAAENPSGVLLSGHYGSVLLLSHMASYMGYKPLLVLRSVGGPMLTRAVVDILQASGQTIIFKDEAYQCYVDLLNKGDCYPTLAADQHGGRSSLHVDFMGTKAYTPAGPASLSRKFNIPGIIGVLIRTGRFRFEAVADFIPARVSDDRQADLEYFTGEMNRILGQWIINRPDQWFWMHRRWRYVEPKPQQ